MVIINDYVLATLLRKVPKNIKELENIKLSITV